MLVCSALRQGPECAYATICTFILLVTIVDPGRQRHGYTVHFYQLLVKDGQYSMVVELLTKLSIGLKSYTCCRF